MKARGNFDFGKETATMLPLILREVTKRQMTIFSKGKLSLPQVVILDFLRERGASRMGDLSKTLHLTMSAVTAIVDKMIKLKLVKRERSRKDRRVIYISLLKKGEKTARQVNEERKKMSADIFSVLTMPEKRKYLRLLRKVYEDLRKRK
ncbi:MAG: hypothetical protein DRP85_04890 [Candidatus Makaraimicrobium thalassicum]|nr:MAG: hypothetical protein DRP85_04890 [Candidatus Omnitrophota bacterium]